MRFYTGNICFGSLREDIKPGDLIFPNQLIDFTKNRKSTFFESFADGMQHTSFADPFDRSIVNELKQLADNLNIKSHTNKTVLTIEGPRFSLEQKATFLDCGEQTLSICQQHRR
jgi:5'-methylthioadenosine phosphorylase